MEKFVRFPPLTGELVPRCNLVAVSHALNSQVLTPLTVQWDMWRNLQHCVCGWMQHWAGYKSPRWIAFKKSNISWGLNHQRRSLVLQPAFAFENFPSLSYLPLTAFNFPLRHRIADTSFYSFAIQRTSLKIYWNYRTTCTTNDFLFWCGGGNFSSIFYGSGVF